MIVYPSIFYGAELQLAFKGKLTWKVADTLHKQFWEKCIEWPHMTLNTTRSKTQRYICVISVPESQIWLCFILWPVRVFDQPFPSLRQVHQMTPNVGLNTTRPNVAHGCYYCPWIPNFSPLCSTTSDFRVTGHLRQGHLMTQKWPWILQGQSYPHMCVTNVPESHISPHFPLWPTCFRDTKLPITGNAPNDLRMTLNTLYTLTVTYFWGLVHSTTSCFQNIRLLKMGKSINVLNDLRLILNT